MALISNHPKAKLRVYYWDQVFRCEQLDEYQPKLNLPNGQELVYQAGRVYLDHKQLSVNRMLKLGTARLVILEFYHQRIHTLTAPKIPVTITHQMGMGQLVGSQAEQQDTVNVLSNPLNNGYSLYLTNSANSRVYLDGRLCDADTSEFRLTRGSQLVVNGLLIVPDLGKWQITVIDGHFHYDRHFFASYHEGVNNVADFPYFNRSPRLQHLLPDHKVALKMPPNPQTAATGELGRTIIPSVGMLVVSFLVVWLSQQDPIMMLTMGTMSLLTIIVSTTYYFKQKNQRRRENEIDIANYERYLTQKNYQLNQYQQEQQAVLAYRQPTIAALEVLVAYYDSRIFERLTQHEDFLSLRLGTAALIPSYQVEMNDTTLKQDELQQKVQRAILQPHQQLTGAPFNINLLNRTVGVVGQLPVLVSVMKTWLIQLATFHSYHDVQFLLLLPGEQYQHFHAYRWLKQFHLNKLGLRGIVADQESQEAVLDGFYQLLQERHRQVEAAGDHPVHFGCHYVVVILDAAWLTGHAIQDMLTTDISRLGATVIWGQQHQSELPDTVTTLLDYQNGDKAQLVNERGIYQHHDFYPMTIPDCFDERLFVRNLGNLIHRQASKIILPETISFLEMYQVQEVTELNIKQRWQQANPSESIAVPIGIGVNEHIVELDLHEGAHGPHGLVAGTTGSGKSETLQSIILSLAVNFSPEDVGFLPIDFKGGGMANLFSDLPHLMGVITNLEGVAVNRALASVHAELEKRQRWFNEYGVNSINDYTSAYRKGKGTTDKAYPQEPLPHLFLIVDEFAELKTNQPEFMTELISTARIGRSLGVHLILATQKPSGVIDDQIWSNTRFKLALKVQDTTDSNEILKRPDAAYIKEVGRAYLQVGHNEVYELFQSAYSGVDYQPHRENKAALVDKRIWTINHQGQAELALDYQDNFQPSKVSGKSQLAAVIAEIQKSYHQTQYQLPSKPWLPPLPQQIVADSGDYQNAWQKPSNLSIVVGILDQPKRQVQPNWTFNIEEVGHTAVFGSAGSGKSTFLQTLVMALVRQNTPDQIRFNLFDFTTNGLLPVAKLPHVVDHCPLGREDQCRKYMQRILAEIKTRKRLFKEANVSNIDQYHAVTGKSLPRVMTIVDGYDNLKDSPQEESFETGIAQLLREGASLGYYVIVTVVRESTLKMALRSIIPNNLVYYLVDESSCRSILGREALPVENVIGRLQIKYDDQILITQTALPSQGDCDIDRMQALACEIEEMDSNWQGERPTPVPMVPEYLSWDSYWKSNDVQELLCQGQLPIGLDQESVAPYGLQLARYHQQMLIYDLPKQKERLNRIVLKGLSALTDTYQVVILDCDDTIQSANFGQYVSANVVKEYLEGLADQPNESNKPVLLYISNWLALAGLAIPASFLEKLLYNPRQSIHSIAMVGDAELMHNYDEISMLLKNNLTTGLYGGRLQYQNYLRFSIGIKENDLADDEIYHLEEQVIRRLKLPIAI